MDTLNTVANIDRNTGTYIQNKLQPVRPYTERIGLFAVTYLFMASRNPFALTSGFLAITTVLEIGRETPSTGTNDNSVLYPLAKRLCVVGDVLALTFLVRTITGIGSLKRMSRGAGALALTFSLAWIVARGADLARYQGKLIPTAASCRAEGVRQLWNNG